MGKGRTAVGAEPTARIDLGVATTDDDFPNSTQATWIAAAVRALRPHQWSKNVLVFVPVVAAHRFSQLDLWLAAGLSFVAFSFCASAIYIINDISDIESDRLHPRKRLRPFAAGELRIAAGIAIAALLLLAAFATALSVSVSLVATLAVYVAATTLYSFSLKKEPVADVFALAELYVLRIVAGGMATATPLSSWLLAFALFFFLSLAFVKRYVELITVNGRMAGRGYGSDDALWMHAVGTSAGYMAVLVLVLYVNVPDVAVLYRRPEILWFLCPMLLYWLTRLWFRAGRGLVHDDPVFEAVKDPASYVLMVAFVLVMLAAI
jgi:4-hydroxybenzoate polyprenyltransferase